MERADSVDGVDGVDGVDRIGQKRREEREATADIDRYQVRQGERERCEG